MTNPTTPFSWQMPTSTDLVTDLPADFEVFGQAVATSLADLLGGTTGQVLAKASGTDMDFTWIEQDDTTIGFNAQTGTTYTLVAADLGKIVTLSNTSNITLTVPPSVFATGNIINIQAINTGQVTLAQGAGVTITSTGATSTAPKLRVRYSAASIICTASNTFTVIGDIS
jgi:predicted secreted protein